MEWKLKSTKRKQAPTITVVTMRDTKTGDVWKAEYPEDSLEFEEDFIVLHAFGENADISILGDRNSVPVRGTPYYFDKQCGCRKKAANLVEIFITKEEG